MLSSKHDSPKIDNISSIAYRRTSIPSISSLFSRRPPLAPLHHQPSSLDDHMPPTQPPDLARKIIPKINRSHEDDPSQSTSRRRSIPGQAATRPLPYPPTRPTLRRPSNTPSASISTSRRPSLPGTQPYPSPIPPFDPLHSSDNDLYSGLSTFTFGAALPSDSSDLISPLTRLSSSSSSTPTPRPSLSGPSGATARNQPSQITSKQLQRSTPKQKPKDGQSDPDLGDDENEDEEDIARHRRRSKMRAIDDGSRRPSLPSNVYSPAPLLPSSPSPPSHSAAQSPNSPSSIRESDPDPEDPEQADFDTDVEFDPPLPDTASQHTFGIGGTFDHYGHRSSYLPPSREYYEDEISPSWGTGREHSVSPVAFVRHGYDSEGPEVDTLHIDSSSSASTAKFPRRGSMPWKIPSATSPRDPSARDREDSTATVTAARRPSRSVEEDSKIHQANNGDGASTSQDDEGGGKVGVHPPALMAEEPTLRPTTTEEPTNVYEGLDMDYILSPSMGIGGDNLRRSWSSGAPSYVQRNRAGAATSPNVTTDTSDAFSWMWSGPEGRRPSTMTVLTTPGEDVFTRHLRKNDLNYNARRLDWSFKKESTDGRGPKVPSVAGTSGTAQTIVGPTGEEGETRIMVPGTQEIWRQAYIGRFKVDRLHIEREYSGCGVHSDILTGML